MANGHRSPTSKYSWTVQIIYFFLLWGDGQAARISFGTVIGRWKRYILLATSLILAVRWKNIRVSLYDKKNEFQIKFNGPINSHPNAPTLRMGMCASGKVKGHLRVLVISTWFGVLACDSVLPIYSITIFMSPHWRSESILIGIWDWSPIAIQATAVKLPTLSYP